MKKNKLFDLFAIASFILLAIMLVVKEFQNDTFYAIKVGEQIFKTGIDMQEHFSFVSGLTYTYPHWLFDCFVYLIYHSFGFFGLYVATIFLTFLLFLTMYKTTSKIVSDRYLAFILVTVLGFTLKNFMTARAQLVSYILFVLILYSIEMLEQTGKTKYSVYIFVSSVLIANFHTATYLFIFVLFMPYLASYFISFIKNKYQNKINKYQEQNKLSSTRIEIGKTKFTKKIIVTFIINIFTGFLTPQKMLPFTYYIKTKMGISLANISEHLPTTIDKRPELFIILGLLIFILLLANMKIQLKDLFLLGGLFLLAFMAKRNYALFAILSVFSIARILKLFTDNRLNNLTIEKVIFNKYIATLILLMFGITAFFKVNYGKNKDYVNKTKYPVELSDYIVNNLDYKNIRIYNEYNFGSYLLFRGIPVFIDSRADLYTEEFNKGCTIFKDGVISIFKNYQQIFDKYNITHVVIYNSNKLKSILERDASYQKIYSDDYFSMYSKNI